MKNSAITVVILVKNAGNSIKAALESVAWADEIICIDNGSTDQSAEIVRKSGAKVLTDKSTDFAGLRNLGLAHARSPWLIYLDADEVVAPGLVLEIQKLLNAPDAEVGAYLVPRVNYYFNTRWPGAEYLERVFAKSRLVRWYGRVHESPEYTGKCLKLTNPIIHYTHTDLTSMTAKTNDWSAIEAALLFENKHPVIVPWRIMRVFVTGWWRSFVRGGARKMGALGVIESVFQGFSMAVTYLKLWEIQNKKLNQD